MTRPTERWGERTTPSRVIEVHPWRDGLWQWRFRDLTERFDLPSNRSYESREEAEGAARQAFPGVPVAPPVEGTAGARVGVAVSTMTVVALVVLAVLTMIGVAILAMALVGWVLRRRKEQQRVRRSSKRRTPRPRARG